ncbi:MAG: hypothetical protein QM682_13295 [Paracoccus sp. (in: a-proteobacteria)]|uniref:hypothetical protein n=1 Tax=Paracoccus sp. TaxID=267 RepID=UPI0039E3E2C9
MVDLATISETQWIEARRRAESGRPHGSLGSERHVYTLVRRMREAGGAVSALLPKDGRGGRGRIRLAHPAEELMTGIIEGVYLTSQKRNAADVVREVRRRFAASGQPASSANTVRRRIKALLPAPICLIMVDPVGRLPIGRPYLTALSDGRHRRFQPVHRRVSPFAGYALGNRRRALPDTCCLGQDTAAGSAPSGSRSTALKL